MDQTKTRLLETIFTVVLELADDVDFAKVQQINTDRWDSLATASLAAAVEMEYGILFDAGDYDRLTSFPAVVLLLEEKGL